MNLWWQQKPQVNYQHQEKISILWHGWYEAQKTKLAEVTINNHGQNNFPYCNSSKYVYAYTRGPCPTLLVWEEDIDYKLNARKA